MGNIQGSLVTATRALRLRLRIKREVVNVDSDTKSITYRLFWTNGAGRITTVPAMLEAQSDAEAVKEAERMAQGRTVEVWDRSRKVAMLNGAERH